MPDDQYSRLIFKVAELERRLAGMIRPATVKEVKGDKMRMVIGKDKDGQEVLGPWMDTTNHRGGARERRFYKEGQNLMLIAPNGDLSQAAIAAFAPNKKFRTPDHANKKGQDEETYQLEDMRVKKTKKGYAIWLQQPKQQNQQQQDQQGLGGGNDSKTEKPEEHEPQKPDPDAIIQLAKDGGITARVGKDENAMRVAVNKNGAKLKAGDNYVTVTKDGIFIKGKKLVMEGTDEFHLKSNGDFVINGKVYVKNLAGPPLANPPWEQGEKAANAPSDGVEDDNKVLDEEENQEGEGEGGGGEGGG